MRKLAFLLLIFTVHTSYAQKELRIDNFSPDYYGKVKLDKPEEVFSPGWVAIYDKKTNKELFKVASEELAVELHDGKAIANVKQLPYGEQSVIIYEDFNFDGVKDFALEDGQNSCYHGPSFQVYLAGKKGFVNDAAYTQLAQENCGMFQVDAKNKTISTSTKDGCCWHSSSVYKIVNGKLKVVEVYEQDAQHLPVVTETSKKWNGTKMVTTVSRTIDKENSDNMKDVLSFSLEKNKKKVQLFVLEETLWYVFLGADGKVEFALPADAKGENDGNFTIKASGNTKSVVFKNDNASYEIQEGMKGADAGKVSLIVTVAGKTYPSAGSIASKKGSLKALPANLSNMK